MDRRQIILLFLSVTRRRERFFFISFLFFLVRSFAAICCCHRHTVTAPCNLDEGDRRYTQSPMRVYTYTRWYASLRRTRPWERSSTGVLLYVYIGNVIIIQSSIRFLSNKLCTRLVIIIIVHENEKYNHTRVRVVVLDISGSTNYAHRRRRSFRHFTALIALLNNFFFFFFTSNESK